MVTAGYETTCIFAKHESTELPFNVYLVLALGGGGG